MSDQNITPPEITQTVEGDPNGHIYRTDPPAHLFADSIAYDVGLEVPQVDDTVPGLLEYYFASCNVTVAIEGCDPKGNAEIRIWAGDGDLRVGIAYQEIKLMSQRDVTTLLRKLQTSHPQITTWQQILDNVAWRSVQHVRTSKPILELGTQPETMRQSFRLHPILHEDEPTTIYCPGGVGKSYLANFIACLVQFDRQGFSGGPVSETAGDIATRLWTPIQGNVLYCDWESTHKDHQRRTWAIKRGLGIEGEETFMYLPCDQPLSVIIPDIKAAVERQDIKLVIIDSQMAASETGPDQAGNGTRFFNALRSLHCATLVLDHVSKATMQLSPDSDGAGPYGTVVKGNRSRQQYELKKHQVPGQGYTDLVLIHRKNNEGPLADEFGIRITWENDQNGHLDRVTLKAYDVGEHPVLSATQPIWKRVWDALEGGTLTLPELVELMPDKAEATIRATLYRDKGRFVRVSGDQWGRRAAE